MLTYELKKSPGVPLYEALYRCIRGDILSGKLPPNAKLPSKRALAEHLEVSKITVETAYGQLLEEGYIRSAQKVGYFVEPILQREPAATSEPAQPEQTADLGTAPEKFPFSVFFFPISTKGQKSWQIVDLICAYCIILSIYNT